MTSYGHLKEDFLDTFAKPWIMVERVRLFMTGRDDRKIYDFDVALELGLTKTALGSYKNRTSATFTLYVIKWCMINNLDILEFIKK
jgi:hypothetical protein